MENAIKIVAALLIGALMLILGAVLGFLAGAAGGWAVGWFFPETMGLLLDRLFGGVRVEPWQLGGMLGFVAGFFKVTGND